VAFAQKEIVRKQSTGAGGLFSILLNVSDKAQMEKFISGVKHFLFAVSWGGHESLILPFLALFNIPNHPEPDVPYNLVRIYIGLEEADFLIDGLKAGFMAMKY
jgi:cystathionine beta-lyase/cystathionine gamma-synthase